MFRSRLAMLSAALSERPEQSEWLGKLPSLSVAALALEKTIEIAAERYRYMSQCVVLGRGFNYATAFEWALKLKELAYIVADAYSPADFQHGPMALAQDGFPVLAVVPRGGDSENLISLLKRLVEERRVELLAISNEQSALGLAHTALKLPEDLPEWMSPIQAIIPAQLFCYYLTRTKGHDTEAPRGLSKVTRTW